MDPPTLRQGTSATVEIVPHFDLDGSMVGIVLIKERFVVSRQGVVRRVGEAPIHVADEPWDPDAPESSSIKYPSDLCLRKPSTDVIVVGAAMAPYRAPVRQLDVSIQVGPVDKTLRVFGPRAWYKRGIGKMGLTDPQPFEQQNLQWEFAWGGSDYESDPEKPMEEPRNPNGRGLVRDPDSLDGQLAPSIENPEKLIKNHRTHPPPAGVGAIGRHWVPRRTYSGTYDEAWMEERMPLLPLDFDDRFNQCAPPDQVAPQPLRGGERVAITNMHAEGPVAFELPKMRFFVGIRIADRTTEAPPAQLDTVMIEPNSRMFDMTWRTLVRLPRRPNEVDFVQVHEKRLV